MPIKARCGRADEVPPGSSKVVQINERVVAIFNVDGTLHALDNTCPHQGGPLGEGYLEDNGVVSCPWHGWTFDVCRSEEHTSELQSRSDLVCRLLLEKKKKAHKTAIHVRKAALHC